MAWICDKNGNHRCEIKQLSYNGTFMEVSSITVTVESPAPVSFAIGDYIDWDYDGLRYTLDIAAGVEKQARRNSVGNAFVYENLVFLSPLKAADNADFLDVILGNTNDFLTNTEFSFYGTAWDYAKRLEANLCRLYGSGTWKVRIWTGGICYDDSPATGIDTGAWENKLVDVSGIKCLGGFQQIYDLWGCAYVFSVVNGVNYVDFYDDFEQYAKAWAVGGVDKVFAYGKGNGLYKIRHTPDSDHVLVTRLRPYGSGENIPANYYFNSEDYHVDGNESSELAISHLMLPASQWTKGNVKHPSNAYLEQNTDLYGVREGVVLWDGSDEELGEIKPSIYGLTIQDLLSLMSAGDSYRPVEAKWPDTSQRIDKIITGASPTDNGAVAEAGYDFTEVEASGSLEDHSFGTGGSYSRADIVFDDLVMGTTPSVSHPAEYRIVPTSQNKIAVSFEVQAPTASTINVVTAYLTPYVGDVKVEDATFPCSVSEETISHTVDGITYKKRYNISLLDSTGNPIVFSTMRTGAVTFHFRAHIDFSVENSGFPFVRNEHAVNFDLIRGSKAIDGFFAVTIPQIGFDLSAAVSSGAKLCMRSGSNQPREFAIVPSSVRYLADSDTWYIRCKRSVDQSIKTYFPNSDAVIAPGDEYYLSGIVMPSLYVEIAANKLLAAATAWLNRHSKPRMLSSVDVDNKIMVEESIVLKEGMALPISDTDLGITTENQESRVIDNIRIEEGTDSIRTFSITLRDKKEKSSLDAAIRGATSNFATNSSVSEALNAAANTGHGTLTGRDMPNQHPISAITGLEDALLSSGFFELGEQEYLVRLKQAYDYLGPRKGLIFDSILENDTSNADLYVKWVGEGTNRQRVLYSPLALITEGDQIVVSGTPGGGGGGVSYLRQLDDVYHNSTNVRRYTSGTVGSTDLLAYDSTKGWYAVQLGSGLELTNGVLTATGGGGGTTYTSGTVAELNAGSGTVDRVWTPKVLADWLAGKGYITGITSQMVTDALGYTPLQTAVTSLASKTGAITIDTNTLSMSSGKQLSVKANTFQPLDADLTAIAALTGNGFLKKTGETWGMDTNTYLTSHQSVTLASGTNNGTLKLTTAAGTVDNIAVKGLGAMAYESKADWMAYSFEDATSTNQIDLDDYTSSRTGIVKMLSWMTGNAQYVSNRPGTSNRAADVYVLPNRWGGLQLYVDYANPVYYIRNRYDDWTDWVELYHSGNLDSSKVQSILGAEVYHPYGGEHDANAAKTFYIGGAKFTWHPATQSAAGYLELDSALLTLGDQIVVSGTPGGGGGGGAQYLYELSDVLTDSGNTKVKESDGTTNAAAGDIFAYNGSKWYALKLGTGLSIDTSGSQNVLNAAGGVSSVAGKTGAVTIVHSDLTDWNTATSGFLTSAVTSLGGKTGAITLSGGLSINNNNVLSSANTTYKLKLNNTTNGDSTSGVDLGTLYAPTAGGASNKVLIGKGTTTTPEWSGFTLTGTSGTAYNLANFLTSHQTLYNLVIKNSAGTAQVTYKPAVNATYELTLTKAMVGLGNVDNLAASGYFTLLSNNNNQLSVTVGGTNKKLTVGYATNAAHATYADYLPVTSITSEESITESGVRAYSGSGSTWGGSIISMAYAAILAFGAPGRGWQMWSRRENSAGMYWRRGNSDATDWSDARLFLDNANYSSVLGSVYHPLGGEHNANAAKTFYIGGAKFTWHPATQSAAGYLELDSALLTLGDQIVVSGTPGGGGGGGAQYLYELSDVADSLSSPSNGVVLQYNGTEWTGVAPTTIGITTDATQSAHGLMSATDKTKLDGIATGATNVTDATVSGWGYVKSSGITSVTMGDPVAGGNVSTSGSSVLIQFPTAYSLPVATTDALGGIKIGYSENNSGSATDRNYAVKLSSQKAYVNVPWTDTKNTTGADNTTSKFFLVGPTAQTTSNGTARTYSNGNCYASGGYLYSGGTKVLTAHQSVTDLIGTSAIGGTAKPIYYTGSGFAAITASKGNATNPIYLDSGEFKAGTPLGAMAYEAKADWMAYSFEDATSTNQIDLDDYTSSRTGIVKMLSWMTANAQYVSNRPGTSNRAADVYVLPNRWGGLQLYVDYANPVYYIRNRYDDWTDWVELYHTGNLTLSTLAPSDAGSASRPIYYANGAFSAITSIDLLSISTGYVKAKRFYLDTNIWFEWVENSGNGYVKLNAPFVTEGDQIVLSGTPGGGGGGAQYLYELSDVADNLQSPATGKMIFWNGSSWVGTTLDSGFGSGRVMQWDGSKWTTVAPTTIGITTDATQSVHGLMSTSDKTKLDGIATGATAVTDSTVSGWGYLKTDENVKQTATTTNAAYELLFSYSASNTTSTEGTRKTSTLTYNPSTKALSTGGAVNGLTLTAATTGFTISGGTTSKTLTVNETGTAVLLAATQALTNKTYNGYTLAAACAKAVDSSISAASTSANLPTSAAVASFVEGKNYITGNQTITLSGDVSGSGTTSISVSIGNSKVTNAMLAGSIAWSKLSVSASDIVSTLGNTSVNRATADGDGKNISTTYLKLIGGTMTGDLIIGHTSSGGPAIYYKNGRATSGAGGWADNIITIQNAAESAIASFGMAGSGDILTYIWLGQNAYNGDNLRVYSDKLQFGNNVILHAGNYTTYTPILNSASTHATSSSVIYAPTSAGTSGYWLKSTGGEPTWESMANMEAGSVTTAADTSNTLYLVGVTSSATKALKYNSSVTIKGGALSATSLGLSGALSGATTGAFSSNVTVGGTLGVTGIITATGGIKALDDVAIQKSGGGCLTLLCGAVNSNDGCIIFADRTTQRNGFKIASEYGSTASRQNLVFYSSNNNTSPYEPVWNPAMTIKYDGTVAIGTTTFDSGVALNVGGIISSSGDQVVSSDATLKTNWRGLNYGVMDIAKCTAGVFDWKDGHGTSAGTKAQDWKGLIPELVHGEEGGMTLAYGQIALLNTILLARHETEQDKEIRLLKERVAELENEVKRLRS